MTWVWIALIVGFDFVRVACGVVYLLWMVGCCDVTVDFIYDSFGWLSC